MSTHSSCVGGVSFCLMCKIGLESKPDTYIYKVRICHIHIILNKKKQAFVMMLQGWMVSWLTIQLAFEKASSLI